MSWKESNHQGPGSGEYWRAVFERWITYKAEEQMYGVSIQTLSSKEQEVMKLLERSLDRDGLKKYVDARITTLRSMKERPSVGVPRPGPTILYEDVKRYREAQWARGDQIREWGPAALFTASLTYAVTQEPDTAIDAGIRASFLDGVFTAFVEAASARSASEKGIESKATGDRGTAPPEDMTRARLGGLEPRVSEPENMPALKSTASRAKEAVSTGLVNPKRPGMQTHNRANVVRKILNMLGSDFESAHILPQAIGALLKKQGIANYSPGKALTTLLPRSVHQTFDLGWTNAWSAAKKAGKPVTVDDIHRMIDQAIEGIPDKQMPVEGKRALQWKLYLELYSELGLEPGTEISVQGLR